MLSPATYLVGAIFGAGSVITAVTVPVTLFFSNKEQSVQIETEHTNGVTSSEQDILETQRVQSPKSRNEWGVEEFKKYCYGNFLKQENKGELVICLDRSVNKESSIPLFYLRWTEGGKDEFNEIVDISVENYSRNHNQTITFELKNQRESKSLQVDKSHVGLTVLQIGRSQFNQLSQERCKESREESEGNYSLKCKYWNGKEYNATATKLA